MDPQQQFCLKWNSFGSNLATAFGNLFKSESLADVTLFCEGVTFKAHKLILAACSKHFQDLFEGAPFSPSVLVILDGTSSSNMSALLEFMYKGEVHVSQEHLSSFLKAAECLQVKGLSIEHEKLAMVQAQHTSPTSHENPMDSPNSRSKPKLPSNGTCKESIENGPSQEPPPSHSSSSSYSPVLSTYMHPHHYRPPYEQRVPPSAPGPGYDCPRKRHHRSPSDHQDSVVRASVLREASSKSRSSETEKLSPMSLSYRPSPEPKHAPDEIKNYSRSSPQNLMRVYDGKPDSRELAGSNTAASAAAAVTFDRTAAVDVDNNHKIVSENRHSDSSCPEDLRVKMDSSSRCEEVHSNAMLYKEMSADKAPEMVQVGSIWDASAVTKPLSHKGSATPDGKKLKCPFCERLYGYETNLRAHIRQRHQGIRVPCPFCSRTFTRNNTVRRHIAREHKTELSLKAFQQNQVRKLMGTVVCLPENLAKICGESAQWLVIKGTPQRRDESGPPGPVEKESVHESQPRCTMVTFDHDKVDTSLASRGDEQTVVPLLTGTILPAVAPASVVIGRIVNHNSKTDFGSKVASPPDRKITRDDTSLAHCGAPTGGNGQLAKSGSLTIVRRSSTKKPANRESCAESPPQSPVGEESLNVSDLATDKLPAVDTPDACDKAALRLRCLLRLLERGEIPAEVLQKNLLYAARVLEAVFIDETKRLADEDDELSEVQPDAVPPEVREWLASTFTRQLGTTRRKADEKPKFRSVAHAIRAGIFVDRIYRRVTSSAMMHFPPEVIKVLKTLDEWSFDVFALSEAAGGQPVKYLGYDLLNRYGMIHKFKVPPLTLETFLTRVEEGYCRYKNPYHNNLHAADVAQTVHYLLCQTGLMNWLTDLEIFATLVAALIHDFEHTGTTNNFHVMSGSDTALLYNDRAVLENHHISASFRLLKEEDCNILQSLSRDEYREFRTLVIDMVLATDMSFHFQQLKNMKNILTLAEPSVDKSKASSLVLHCCDISHPAKRWDLHCRWTDLLLEEFFRQGDMERDLGLPFSPLCDRNTTLIAESQIGFIEFIVEPSLGVCSDMLEAILSPLKTPEGSPENSIKINKPWVQSLAQNKKKWREQAAKDAEIRERQGQTARQQSDDSESTAH